MNLHINSSRTDPSLDYSISKLEKIWLYGNAAMLSLRLGSVSANMAAGAICAQKQETGKKGSNLSIWLGHLHTRTYTHTCNPARRNEWFDADRWRARRHLKQPNKNGRRFLLLFWGCPFPPRPSGQIEPVDDLYFPAHAHADTHTHTHTHTHTPVCVLIASECWLSISAPVLPGPASRWKMPTVDPSSFCTLIHAPRPSFVFFVRFKFNLTFYFKTKLGGDSEYDSDSSGRKISSPSELELNSIYSKNTWKFASEKFADFFLRRSIRTEFYFQF